MTKVAISGGGRCNVLHDTSKPIPEILNGYPRGKRELNGLFQKWFSPSQMEDWFTEKGVELKTEQDGRMFPITDSSQTIIDCIMNSAKENGVKILTKQKVESINASPNNRFTVSFHDNHSMDYDSIILATGSNPSGHDLAKSLGHKIIQPVPSLFTISTKNQNKEGQVFNGLSGVSLKSCRVQLKVKVEGRKKKTIIEQEGPLLITHHGLSGPAILRLSAFAAREFKDMNYRGDVFIHFAPAFGNAQTIEERLWQMRSSSPKRSVTSACPLMDNDGSSAIPKRLWAALVLESGFEKDTVWAEAPKKKVAKLSRMISEFVVDMTGKGVFKDEFVTAGGVSLKEIVMKSMESKVCDGLFFCGECIDVDGVTGGFNFMNCWSTGFMAGNSAVDKLTTE